MKPKWFQQLIKQAVANFVVSTLLPAILHLKHYQAHDCIPRLCRENARNGRESVYVS